MDIRGRALKSIQCAAHLGAGQSFNALCSAVYECTFPSKQEKSALSSCLQQLRKDGLIDLCPYPRVWCTVEVLDREQG